MRRYFQKEIPKARINITLNLETSGSKKQTELPFKILVLGDFSRGKTHIKLAQRERLGLTKNNLDQVLSILSPELSFSINNPLNQNHQQLDIQLSFTSMKDFEPHALITQIPPLRRLIAMRNLLKDMKSTLIDKASLRQELTQYLNTRSQNIHASAQQ